MVERGVNDPKRRLANHQRSHLFQAIDKNDKRLAAKLIKNGIKNLLEVPGMSMSILFTLYHLSLI